MSTSHSRRWAVVAAVGLLLILFVRVEIVTPRVHVRWADAVTASEQTQLEQRYRLGPGERVEGRTWRYALEDRSTANIRALVSDRSVADTAYLDRDMFAAPGRQVQVSLSRLRALVGPAPAQLLQPQSLLLGAIAVLLLWGARSPSAAKRRRVALAASALVVLAALALPLRQPIRMGDSGTYTASRESFELFSGVTQIRFEAHLSHAILGRLDELFGKSPDAPARALRTLATLGTLLFAAAMTVVGRVEGWSPVVLRYLALALLAPSALLYLGYLELGQLSLSLAAFPLIVRGLQRGTREVEAGAALAGFGAALHGFGLLSLAGAGIAAVLAPAPLRRRSQALLGIVAWGTTAYLCWVVLYLVILKLPLVPGHAESIPLRPWLVSAVGDRVNAAIFSAAGARDVLLEAWLVGVPLLAVVMSLRRSHRDLVRLALPYALPSLAFLVIFWPVQGLGVEMDLVFAAFPATYALAWVCAQDPKRTMIAAGLFASAHLVFWRVVLDTAFVNSRLG